MTCKAKAIKKKLCKHRLDVLDALKVNKYDRTYQVWKRTPQSLELFSEKTFLQKLEYIHENPVAAGVVNFAEEYKYSSAKSYLEGVDEFNIITHYTGNWLFLFFLGSIFCAVGQKPRRRQRFNGGSLPAAAEKEPKIKGYRKKS